MGDVVGTGDPASNRRPIAGMRASRGPSCGAGRGEVE